MIALVRPENPSTQREIVAEIKTTPIAVEFRDFEVYERRASLVLGSPLHHSGSAFPDGEKGVDRCQKLTEAQHLVIV